VKDYNWLDKDHVAASQLTRKIMEIWRQCIEERNMSHITAMIEQEFWRIRAEGLPKENND
jgi:hypothetical protein